VPERRRKADDPGPEPVGKIGIGRGAAAWPFRPDPPRPSADATAEEILAHYRGDEAAMRRELECRGRELQLRMVAESIAVLRAPDPIAEAEQRAEPEPDGAEGTEFDEGKSRGGNAWKQHPGLALAEAVRLIRQGKGMSDVKIAEAATSQARKHPDITGAVIAEHHWHRGMDRRQVPALRAALEGKLVKPMGGTGEISYRSSTREAWQRLGRTEWAAIPHA
jgi:hypothetical protein